MSNIEVKKMGSYYIGGERVTIFGMEPYYAKLVEGMAESTLFDPNSEYWAGQMYVEYTELANPIISYPICMIHGGGLCGALCEQLLDDGPLSISHLDVVYRLFLFSCHNYRPPMI